MTPSGYPHVEQRDGRPVVPVDADHPGAADRTYRSRRDAIAALALGWAPGDPVPDVAYTDDEDRTWAAVRAGLGPIWEERAAAEVLAGIEALGLPADRVPQLAEVNDALGRQSGFRYQPVAGLAPLRRFYEAFGDGVFWSTQYVRHASRPLYTPEPDVCHEVLGHAHQLADPRLAGLYRSVAAAAARVETDEALRFLSRVFWRTFEFGIVREGSEIKAYGAGLLSSVGELQALPGAHIEPVDWAVMGTVPYDITRFQSEVFCAPSMEWLFSEMEGWLAAYDDDVCASLVATAR